MARPPKRTTIDSTDVSNDLKPAVDIVASVFNQFMEEVVGSLEGKLDFENINIAQLTITVRVDSQGNPITGGTFKNPLRLKKHVSGPVCIRAQNVKNPGTYPTSTPFISFQEADGIVTIRNVTNLQANQDYKLTLIIF